MAKNKWRTRKKTPVDNKPRKENGFMIASAEMVQADPRKWAIRPGVKFPVVYANGTKDKKYFFYLGEDGATYVGKKGVPYKVTPMKPDAVDFFLYCDKCEWAGHYNDLKHISGIFHCPECLERV